MLQKDLQKLQYYFTQRRNDAKFFFTAKMQRRRVNCELKIMN